MFSGARKNRLDQDQLFKKNVKEEKNAVRSEKVLYTMFNKWYWLELFSMDLTTRNMCLLLDKFDEFFYPYNVTQDVADGT